MTARNWWRLGFLSVTGLAVLLEIVAATDGNPDTDPWTDLIVAYVPLEVAVLAFGGLAAWLLVHFGVRYARKRQS